MKSATIPLSRDYALLQSFIDAVTDPCVAVDSAGYVLAVNRAWKELPRRNEAANAAKHPVGSDYLALFQSSTADETLERALMGIRAVLHGEQDQYEHEYIRPIPHTIRWFRMTVQAWRQLDASALIFHRDITAEKMGHATSQSGDREFRLLADSAPVMIWMSGPDKSCIFVSRKWLEFTGARLDDALGDRWPRFVHPDDRDALISAFRAAFDQKCEFSHEYRLRHKDGSFRWVRDTGSPRFDAHHKFSGFTGSVWDISEHKQASDEAHRATRYARLIQEVAAIAKSAATMREALQRSVDSICVLMGFPVGHALLMNDDEPGLAKPANIVYVKDFERFKTLSEACQPLTWPAVEDLPREVLQEGKPSISDIAEDSLTPSEDRSRLAAAFEAGLRGGVRLPIVVDDKVEAIFEFGCEESVAKDTELFDTLIVATERLARFFERRRAQIRLTQQKQELQDSADRLFAIAGRLVDSQEEERRRIARDIHDDFTQRLALVSMKIGNLAGRDRASTRDEMDAGLEDIRRATAAVANDLRDLSHQLHPAMLELLGLVAALRTQCEEFQRFSKIETSFESSVSDQDVSPQAATCLYRVLQESLMNIAKHSGSASARVSLARKANKLEMRISDAGRGILPGVEARKGLGLTGIAERVGLLHGRLIVNGDPGRGTEIVVTVPAAQAVNGEMTKKRLSASHPDSSLRRNRRR